MARAEHPDRLSTTVEIYTITGAASVMAVAALSCVGRVGSRVTNISQYTSPWQVQARSSTPTGIGDRLREPPPEPRKRREEGAGHGQTWKRRNNAPRPSSVTPKPAP